MSADQRPVLFFANRSQWKSWLEQNHASSQGFMMVRYKTAHPNYTDCLTYEDAIEEALCWGWIDSVLKPQDDIHYWLQFTPRRRKSVWSAVNKRRIEKLEAQKLIQPAGQEMIDEAKADGSWTLLDDAELGNPPQDFRDALLEAALMTKFELMSKSRKKTYISQLAMVKRPATRASKIQAFIQEIKRS
jgi:uncharacterized protein YdeI (YjbR/CyaY-like superfamily)